MSWVFYTGSSGKFAPELDEALQLMDAAFSSRQLDLSDGPRMA